jgi:hypothetical protein
VLVVLVLVVLVLVVLVLVVLVLVLVVLVLVLVVLVLVLVLLVLLRHCGQGDQGGDQDDEGKKGAKALDYLPRARVNTTACSGRKTAGQRSSLFMWMKQNGAV